MKKFRKQIFLSLGIIVAAYMIFTVYDFLDNQRLENQIDLFLKESRKLEGNYDIMAINAQVSEPKITIYVSEEEKRHYEITYSAVQITKQLGMENFDILVKSANDIYPVLD